MIEYDFKDVNHAAGYLNGGVVRHKGVPVVVKEVFLYEADGGVHKAVRYNVLDTAQRGGWCLIKDLDLTPVPLGMVNLVKNGVIRDAAYLTRTPERRWKIGLTQNATRIFAVRRGPDAAIRTTPINEWWYSALPSTIRGDYPKLEEAMLLMGASRRRAIAFSRNFAIDGERKLLYRHNAEPVGMVTERLKPLLYGQYKWLQEQLMEDVR